MSAIAPSRLREHRQQRISLDIIPPMHRLLSRVTLLLAFAASPLVAQQKTATASPASELIRLENQWTTGLVKRDRVLFEKLLAPKFVYTENDKLMSRADVLHEVAEGSDRVTAAHNEGMVVHEYGPTTAVVTGWLIVSGQGKSGKYTNRYRFTDTWVKGSQGWQIVAAQDYLAPK
jgi:hypothetical protein